MGWKAGAVLIAAFFTLIICLGVIVSGLRTPIQSGTYVGQTIDYSHQRGIIFQTDDLTTKTNDRSSTREDWCVPDDRPELVNKVRDIETGTTVEIEYYAPLWMWPGTCGHPSKVIESISVRNR